jgi:hypothetical protein
LEIRDNLTRDSWRIGDIVLTIKAARVEYGNGVIYAAVGAFVGKSQRTIREYAAISAFYSPETREKYDVLAYDHFRTAMKYGSLWEGALQYAINTVNTLNRPATVDMMETMFEGGETRENYTQTEQKENDGDLGRVKHVAERLLALISRQPELSGWESEIQVFIDFVEMTISRVEVEVEMPSMRT